MSRLHLVALVAGLILVPQAGDAQTTGGRFTVEELVTISSVQAQAAIDAIPEPGSAFMWQNSAAGTPITLPADDTVLTHWTTADGSIAHLLGTDTSPPLDDGDYIGITRAGRYHVFVTVTVTANPAVSFSVYASDNKKKVAGVKTTADGTMGTEHQVSISALVDLALGTSLRVSFSSVSGGTITVYDVTLTASWIGPEINP